MELQAKKSLGQHFLNSKSVLAEIVAAANLQPSEVVLEIGPGTGVLTEALLLEVAKLISIEKDSRAYDLLKDKFKDQIAQGKLDLKLGDILDTDLNSLGLKDREYALIANIPYYITGAILEMFLEHTPRPNRMVLLVQKEVADRIVARDGKESILSISVKAFGTPKSVAKVPRGAFTPPPTVDSAILSIENISNKNFTDKNIDIKKFFQIVKAGFAHKRKFVKRNLEEVMEKPTLEKIWQEDNLDEKLRAEDMTVGQWLKIVKN